MPQLFQCKLRQLQVPQWSSLRPLFRSISVCHATNKDTQYPEYKSPPAKIGRTLGPLSGVPSKCPPALLLPHLSQNHDAFSVSHANSASLRQGTGCIEDVELRAAVGAIEEPGQEQVAVGAEEVQCLLDQSPSPIASGVPSLVVVPVPRAFSFSVHAATFAQKGEQLNDAPMSQSETSKVRVRFSTSNLSTIRESQWES